MWACVFSFNPLEHIWFLKALNPIFKPHKSEAWKAQGVTVLFPALWHFFCCLNEHHLKCRACESYWTEMRRGQRFPSRYIKGKCSVSPHSLPTYLVVTAGRQSTNAGKKVTGKGSLQVNTTVEVTVSYISRHYIIYLRIRDILTLYSGYSQYQNARC